MSDRSRLVYGVLVYFYLSRAGVGVERENDIFRFIELDEFVHSLDKLAITDDGGV